MNRGLVRIEMMGIERKIFVQNQYETSEEWMQVKNIADRIYDYLSDPNTQKELNEKNIPGAKSQRIEEVITPFAETIGFSSQKKDLFKDYKVSKLRPDYYLKISNTGILIEVERGQTTQNNAALKDLWKTHICDEADHLFLFVPSILKQNTTGKIQGKPFRETVNRLSTFFEEKNYTNVRSVVIFGY